MAKKIAPDPPSTFPTPPHTERAHAYLDDTDNPTDQAVDPCKPPSSPVSLPGSDLICLEDKRVTALSILQSAAATAYESADQLEGSRRQLAMGTVHLIELAQSWVDAVLVETTSSCATH